MFVERIRKVVSRPQINWNELHGSSVSIPPAWVLHRSRNTSYVDEQEVVTCVSRQPRARINMVYNLASRADAFRGRLVDADGVDVLKLRRASMAEDVFRGEAGEGGEGRGEIAHLDLAYSHRDCTTIAERELKTKDTMAAVTRCMLHATRTINDDEKRAFVPTRDGGVGWGHGSVSPSTPTREARSLF